MPDTALTDPDRAIVEDIIAGELVPLRHPVSLRIGEYAQALKRARHIHNLLQRAGFEIRRKQDDGQPEEGFEAGSAERSE